MTATVTTPPTPGASDPSDPRPTPAKPGWRWVLYIAAALFLGPIMAFVGFGLLFTKYRKIGLFTILWSFAGLLMLLVLALGVGIGSSTSHRSSPTFGGSSVTAAPPQVTRPANVDLTSLPEDLKSQMLADTTPLAFVNNNYAIENYATCNGHPELLALVWNDQSSAGYQQDLKVAQRTASGNKSESACRALQIEDNLTSEVVDHRLTLVDAHVIFSGVAHHQKIELIDDGTGYQRFGNIIELAA